MNVFLARYAPLLIGGVVAALLGAMLLAGHYFPALDFLERIEWMTYDWRVRSALNHPAPVSDKLGAIVLDDFTLSELNAKFRMQWPFPRSIYGRVVGELQEQGAKAAAFDIFFQDLRRDYAEERVKMEDGKELSSDDYFARQIGAAGNVILSSPPLRKGPLDFPADLFLQKAAAVGHAVGPSDSDGVVRRIPPFVDDPVHGRVWQLDIVLAGRELGLDLAHAIVQTGRIIIPDDAGGSRVIPLDAKGNMLIDWSLQIGDKRTLTQNLLRLLGASAARRAGKPVRPEWKDRLVIIGSIGGGNNIRDRGATPLGNTNFFGAHLNIANSFLMNRFVTFPSLFQEILLLVVITLLAGWISWRLRALWATCLIAGLAAGYVALAWWQYTANRYWLPIVLPVAGSLIMTHASLVVFRLVLERHHRHRVKSLFGRIVSPSIVELLLEQPHPSWEPTRRMMTVFFADIRGFTEYTDRRRAEAEALVKKHEWAGDRARREFDAAAAETMQTINLYLSAVVGCITKRDGTLDKYIGDCVMAFWGAPLPNERHAAAAVHAAIDAQNAVARLNAERAANNQSCAAANSERLFRGEEPVQPLELLQIGVGLNSGTMTVGFMGSEEHLSNFTVFGEDVNIASRLQTMAGPGVIMVGELTQIEAVRQDPSLASRILSQGLVSVKGVAQPLGIARVLWTKASD